MEYLLLIVGIILLVVGGDLLVKSAVGLANKFKFFLEIGASSSFNRNRGRVD